MKGIGKIGFAVCIACCGAFFASGEVAGARYLKESTSIEDAMLSVVATTLAEDELVRFLEVGTPVLDWAERNSAAWLSADDSDEPLDMVCGFAVWEEVGMDCHDFLATLSKLMFLSENAKQEMDLDDHKAELRDAKSFLESSELPEGARPMAQQMVSRLEQFVLILEKYTPANMLVYEKSRVKVDAFLERFQSIGDEAE